MKSSEVSCLAGWHPHQAAIQLIKLRELGIKSMNKITEKHDRATFLRCELHFGEWMYFAKQPGGEWALVSRNVAKAIFEGGNKE